MQWWLVVLALSFTSGTVVYASTDTWILSTSYGTNLVHIFRATKGFYYEIEREDSSTVKARITLENEEVNWSPEAYTVNNCTSNRQPCIEIITNAVSLKFRQDILFVPVNMGVTITLSSFTANETIGNCFEFRDDEDWFGGPQGNNQRWPVQDSTWDFTSYIPNGKNGMAIAEPYWLNTGGDSLYVLPTSLFFEQRSGSNNESICLYAANVSPYRWRNETLLQYQLFHYHEQRMLHLIMVRNLLPIPTEVPERRKAIYPTWSTGIRYGDNVNDSMVRIYAEEIFENEYNNSMIEIDGSWESCYGSLTFSNHSTKFPDIKNLTDFIHDFGFRVSLSVHPFINSECEEYPIAKDLGYFVQNENGDVMTSWWRGDNASLIDFTNEDAAEWFISRLVELRKASGIDSFKFEAGEPSWAPEPAVLTGSIEESPGTYTTQFARAAAELGNDTEVGTGWQSQDLPLYVRMPKKDATWDSENGLASLIPTLLTMNIAGYGFVVPDIMTGANSTNYPSKELLIRWIQATMFMPSIKHSFVPWDYDNETIQIIRYYTKFRESITLDITNAMDAWVSSVTRTPVNGPIWFIDTNNTEAHKISDEYLLGEFFLVAPVIEEGAQSRDIYLPKGKWHDFTQYPSKTFEGPTWIYNYTAPLNVLPYFIADTYFQQEQAQSGSFHLTSNLIVIFVTTILHSFTTLFN